MRRMKEERDDEERKSRRSGKVSLVRIKEEGRMSKSRKRAEYGEKAACARRAARYKLGRRKRITNEGHGACRYTATIHTVPSTVAMVTVAASRVSFGGDPGLATVDSGARRQMKGLFLRHQGGLFGLWGVSWRAIVSGSYSCLEDADNTVAITAHQLY